MDCLLINRSACFKSVSFPLRHYTRSARLIRARAKKIRLEEVLTERQLSNANLRSEAETPFRALRLILYGFGVISASVGFVVSIPQLAAALAHAPSALQVDDVVRNIGIDLGAAGACAFLYNMDWKARQKQLARLGREETLAALGIELANGKRLTLGDLRGFSRVVVCAGTLVQLQAALEAAEPLKEELVQRGVLFVPVPINGMDMAMLPPPPVEDLRWRATAIRVEQWAEWFQRQLDLASSATADNGLYLGLRLDGRVRASGMGLPPWRRFVMELAPMEGSGAWSGFMDGFDGEIKVFNG